MYSRVDLETCGTIYCYKKLHHIFQTNIDEEQWNGKFEQLFGLHFACFDCIVELQTKDCFLRQKMILNV